MSEVEFTGRSPVTIDGKGRIFLSQGNKDILGENFVISLSTDMKVPAFYTAEAWEERKQQLDRIPDSDRRAFRFKRLVFSNTFQKYNSDAQGRVLIPLAIRQDYGLGEGAEAMLVGTGTTLEIWNAEQYRKTMETMTNEETDETLDYVFDKYLYTSTEKE